jgi:subtilisin family serine protease
MRRAQVADCQDGTMYMSAIASALDYAVRMGAHIVSMSIGMSLPYGFAPNSQVSGAAAQGWGGSDWLEAVDQGQIGAREAGETAAGYLGLVSVS